MGTHTRKQREKEDRKELILKAAQNIMVAKGLHGLSVDLIAAETQLAKGTIYLYFKSKEEILSVLTIRARLRLLDAFEKIARKQINPIEKLKLIVKANYDYNKKYPLLYDLISLYEANHKVTETEEMYESSNKIVELVCAIATEAKNDGSLNPNINPLQFTMVMYGTCVGVLQLTKVRGAIMKSKMGISDKQLLECFVELLENGVRK